MELETNLISVVLANTESALIRFQNLLPILNALTNQGMKERHWETVRKLLREKTGRSSETSAGAKRSRGIPW